MREVNPQPGGKRAIALVGLMLGVGVLYLAQLPGHMRMMNDTLSYFARAHNWLAGRGLNFDDGYVNHPVGYSIILGTMIRAGMDNVYWFIGLNLVALYVGMALMWVYWRRIERFGVAAAAGLGCVCLLSWTMVKHVPMLYTEIVFLALTAGALLLAESAARARWGRRWWLLVLATALVCAAILTRTIAVAMLPALVWAGCGGAPGVGALIRRVRQNRKLLVAVLGAGLLTAAAGLWVIVTSRYFRNLTYRFEIEESPLLRLVHFRLSETGKLLLNMPERLIPESGYFIIYVAGAVFFGLLAVGLWRKRRDWGATEVYVVFTAVLLGIWQSFDTRFWLPVLPFIVGLQWRAVRPWAQRFAAVRWGLAGYATVYALLGLAALGWSLRLTYSGTGYAEKDMFFRPAYRVAYGQADESILRDDNDRRAVNLIRRYDPRTPAALRDERLPIDERGDSSR